MEKKPLIFAVCILVIVTLLLGGCNLPGGVGVTPNEVATVVPAPQSTVSSSGSKQGQTSGPKAGSLMGFVDGSTLAFVPDDANGAEQNGKKGFWITLSPINNYQYSLCVQAGKCQPPSDPKAFKDYTDPNMENSAVGSSAPPADLPLMAESYCGWMQGQPVMPDQLTNFESMISGNFQASGIHAEGLAFFRPNFEDRGLHAARFEYLGLQSSPFDDFSRPALRCVVSSPRPMPLFAHTPIYNNPDTIMESMIAEVASSKQFCQNGVGYLTMDLNLVDEDNEPISIYKTNIDKYQTNIDRSMSSDGVTCETVTANRVVCFGRPGKTDSVVGLLCDSKNDLACPVGFVAGETGCSSSLKPGAVPGFAGWELDASFNLVPTTKLPDQAQHGPMIADLVVTHGVMVTHQLLSGSSPVANHRAGCPAGYYFDEGLAGCASLGVPVNQCLAGFDLNPNSGCVAKDTAWNYPGCPLYQVFDPVNGLCDPSSQTVSASMLVQYSVLPIVLPVCSPPDKPTPTKDKNADDAGSSGSSCPAGQSYVCSGIAHITCTCK